jgi:hypothetical protein
MTATAAAAPHRIPARGPTASCESRMQPPVIHRQPNAVQLRNSYLKRPGIGTG